MILIVGLGNPGEQFKNTRHNVGFRTIDEFAEKNNFPGFKLNKKYNALISENENMLLAKPQTFMNKSGEAVKKIITNYPLPVTDYLVIVHDDVDLPVGSIKIVKDRGSAGHKGVESIIKELKTKDFTRIRIGVCPLTGKPKDTKEFVIKKFQKEELETIKQTIESVSEILQEIQKNRSLP